MLRALAEASARRGLGAEPLEHLVVAEAMAHQQVGGGRGVRRGGLAVVVARGGDGLIIHVDQSPVR